MESGKHPEKTRKLITALAAAAAVLCLAGLLLVRRDRLIHSRPPEKDPTGAVEQQEGTAQVPETVEVPVDFSLWQERNGDVYGWITFPGTNVDYPLVQHSTENSYYLRRDIDGAYSLAGSIYTQVDYNNTDFNDPVTVIYGHNMANCTMFGGLQSYMEGLDLSQESPVIYIYQPNRILTYQVVGSVPYDETHILYYNDFSDPDVYNAFFDGLYETRSFHANLRQETKPHSGDRVIILSTCMNGEAHQRYLILGVLTDDAP